MKICVWTGLRFKMMVRDGEDSAVTFRVRGDWMLECLSKTESADTQHEDKTGLQ